MDQGTKDNFYTGEVNQLLTENLKKICVDISDPDAAEGPGSAQKLDCNFRDGYDHSYYFMSTFIEDHLRFHSKFLLYSAPQ